MAKVMVSIPDELLAQIDRRAAERGTTRSGLLQAAARREIAEPTREELEALLERGRAAMAGYAPIDIVAAIRADRDSR
jgi:metal-responsive CopG/Arc/MetJ family transcriptional regulator